MPIYAYRCHDCGFEKDQLQKISDAPLTVCPSCNGSGFARQLTAPAFQLKGSGWYVTDFRDGGKKKAGGEGGEPADKAADKPTDVSAGSGSAGGEATSQAKADSKPATADSSSGSGGGSSVKAGESPAASQGSGASTSRAASSPSPGASA